jgi:hypothetical protein
MATLNETPAAVELQTMADELLQETHDEAARALKRYSRLLRTELYQETAAQGTAVRLLWSELAAIALRAAHGDDDARQACRTLLMGA